MSQEEEHHETNTKYFPATKKDHERDVKMHQYEEPVLEGIDTYTHTHRYVPAPGRGPFFGLFQKGKQETPPEHTVVKNRGEELQ
jgi:hypothetical protein